MKNIIIILIVIIGVVFAGTGVYFLTRSSSDKADVTQNQDVVKTVPPQSDKPAGVTQAEEQDDKGELVIGKSVLGREITAYHYGEGDTEILFVGGIHGGYSWNTALVAYELMDYLKANPGVIPGNVKVTVIPVLNPDGLNKVVGTAGRFAQADVSLLPEVIISGRFNANNVDINRNFDCDWQSAGTWQKTTVSGGSEVFSEPESLAIRNYIETLNPKAVIVWYSSAGGVFASSCNDGILPETRTILNIYSKASGYPKYDEFSFYKLTGDMVNWLAKKNIPAFSVLLSTHQDIEWDKNRAGIEALFEYYAK